MKLHVATLGLHANERVLSSIMKRGADAAAIFYTEKNKSELVELESLFKSHGIPVESIQTDPWSFEKILADILEVVARYPDADVEFNGSCGTRVMTAAVYMAAILTKSTVLIVSEEKDGGPVGPLLTIEPGQTLQITRPKANILERLIEKGCFVESQSLLGSRKSLKSGSITKHLQDLERAGYVKRKKNGRKKSVTLTDLGRALYNVKKVRKQRVWG